MEYLRLFLVFAKIGGFTFGGGLAMLPILQHEIADKRSWVTTEQLMDYYAIGQCTPGIIAVNVATFVGIRRRGFLGGVVATLGVIAPSVIIISLIAAFIRNFQDVQWVQWAFDGIRPAVAALVCNAALGLIKKSVIDIPSAVIFVLVLVLSMLTNVSPAVFVLIAGVCGVLLKGGKKHASAA